MKKGEKSNTVGGAGKRKVAAEEKGKRISHCIRIRMDFGPKTSKLLNQEEVDKYQASYGFYLNLGIKIEFCPQGVGVSLVGTSPTSRSSSKSRMNSFTYSC